MSTGQAPKIKGQALTKMERMAWKGLLAEQARIDQATAELHRDANEARREIEENHGYAEGALGGMASPPTHDVDSNSWHVIELPQLPGEEPQTTNGKKIGSHAEADARAAVLGIELAEGMKLKDKRAMIEAAEGAG